MRKSSKSIFESPAMTSLLVPVTAIGWVSCESSIYDHAGQQTGSASIAFEAYGADAIPKRSQFGPLELLRSGLGIWFPTTAS
jgi:hypothetical protein